MSAPQPPREHPARDDGNSIAQGARQVTLGERPTRDANWPADQGAPQPPHIKLCGLMRREDIEAANALRPAWIGFVFARKSRRYIDPAVAAALRAALAPGIGAVGVFVDEDPAAVAALLSGGLIDMAQLHGHEDAAYIEALRALTDKPLMQAFAIVTPDDVRRAAASPADLVLLDTPGGGTGRPFDWRLIEDFPRPYFLAGGLRPETVGDAVRRLHPYGVDVSSGIETDGRKDPAKMRAFVEAAYAAAGR